MDWNDPYALYIASAYVVACVALLALVGVSVRGLRKQRARHHRLSARHETKA